MRPGVRPRLLELLARHGIALALSDGKWIPEEIRAWSEVLKIVAHTKDVYGFFNNHFAGHSPASAREMQRRLGQQPVDPESLGDRDRYSEVAMSPFRIALANVRFPRDPEDSVRVVVDAIGRAADAGASIICFPECYVPGYRAVDKQVPPPDAGFLEHAWSTIAAEAGRRNVAVVLGTERLIDGHLAATALVINADGSMAGFQDKVQIDPSEEGVYCAGSDRRVFRTGALTFGVVICHEGWRYPETVRWAARRGAQVVFHPQYHEAEGDSFRPSAFADPRNTFHEKAALCRAAENTCYFATVNYASARSPTTSAIVNPDGTLLGWQPYGEEGLLIRDIDLDAATGLLASRYKPLV